MTHHNYTTYKEWKDWSNQEFGKVTEAASAYFSSEMAACNRPSLAGLKVLELGFGNGQFGAWAQLNGASYCGTELLPELVAAGEALGWNVAPANCDLAALAPPGGLDLAVAFDVFEHLDNKELEATFRAIGAILKPEGLLIARVPSGDSPFARAIQHGDLTHATSLGSSAIAQLAGRSGFDVLQVREPAFPLLGAGPLAFIRRAIVYALRRISFKFIGTVLMGNRHAVLTPNLMFVLRRPA